MVEIYVLPPLFHYYFTVRRTHVRGTWGSKPFYVSPFKLDSSLPHLALGQPRVSRANNGQGQIIFAPQPLSPWDGASTFADIIVFDWDFRPSVKRLYPLIEQALNRALPSSPVETNFCNGFENAAASISCRIIHIYIYSLVLPDYSFPGQDISQGELRVPTLLAGQSRQI